VKTNRNAELVALLNHEDHQAVLAFARDTCASAYPDAPFGTVEKVFASVRDLYEGRFEGYCACRTGYHDFRHAIDVFVATARLLDGCFLESKGVAGDRAMETLLAALLHETGYIQEIADAEGTGAKYTRTHVLRSAEFTLLKGFKLGLDGGRSARIARLILGTDLNLSWDNLSYDTSGDEDRAAAILSAADLLGPMADRAYLEKLLFLYYELVEAGIGGYASAFDILRKTADFYDSIRGRLDGRLGSVSHAVRSHFRVRAGTDRDLYREAIERQMAYLKSIMGEDIADYREKLRRLDLDVIERKEIARLAGFGVVLDPAP